MENCPYCQDALAPPPDQFYETKFFRVLVARNALVDGHVVIMPKAHEPHIQSFDLDQFEELSYLLKKVPFYAMRETSATGYTLFMSDGTPEVSQIDHLQIHVLPRKYSDTGLQPLGDAVAKIAFTLDDATLAKEVAEMKDLMQLPQDGV